MLFIALILPYFRAFYPTFTQKSDLEICMQRAAAILERSFAYHRLGFLTLVYVFLQFVCRLGIFVIPGWRKRIIRYGRFLNQGIIVLAILFGVNWIATLISL